MYEDSDPPGVVIVVDCATDHIGNIVSATTSDAGCPPGQLLITFELLSRAYCVVPD
jgi:hypothetical protein